MKWRTTPRTKDEVSLESGAGFQAILAALEDNPTLAAKKVQALGMPAVLEELRAAELLERATEAQLVEGGASEDAAVEAAVAVVLEPYRLTPDQPTPSPDHEAAATRLLMFLRSAPKTYPPEITE